MNEQSPKKRRFRFEIILISIIAAIFVLTILAKNYPYFPFDLYITLQVQSINLPLFKELMLFISWLGNPAQVILSLAIFSIALFLTGLKKESWILIFSTLGAVGISEIFKVLVLRPRPDANLITQVESFYRSDSFPSGHVLFFCGFYGFLLFLTYTRIRKRNLRNMLTAFFLGLIILAGVSRIYLGSHWFSDVVGAYLIGSVWLYIVVLIFKKFKVQ